jgi:hypothetical protein
MSDDQLNAPVLGPPTATLSPHQPVVLFTSARQRPPPLTANQATDAHTGLTRGLAQYLRTLSTGSFADGRDIRLIDVAETWSEPEKEACYPCGCIYAPEIGHYDASRLSPEAVLKEAVPAPDGRFIIKTAEFTQDLVGELWCTDNKQRMAVAAMVETGLTASNFMYGVKLLLPHYFNSVGIYELKDMGYIDSAELAKERIRKIHFVVSGQISVLRLAEIPGAKPRATATTSTSQTLGPGYVVPPPVDTLDP